MKIIKPICQDLYLIDCSLKDYIMEIAILLLGIILCMILVGCIGYGLWKFYKGIKFIFKDK